MVEIGTEHRQQGRLVVAGPHRPVAVWPAERRDLAVAAPAAEVGGVDAVVELLATIEAEDPAAYRQRYRRSVAALRALTAHCQAAILQAAARVEGDLSPEAVLTEVHAALRTPIQPAIERLAS